MADDLRQKILETTETRLRVRFPESYRRAQLDGRSLMNVEHWDLLAVQETKHFRHSSWIALHEQRGVIVGQNVDGDPLFFQYKGASKRDLDAPLYMYRQSAKKIEKVCADFDALLPTRSPAASSAVRKANPAPEVDASLPVTIARTLVHVLVEQGNLELTGPVSRGVVVAATAAIIDGWSDPTDTDGLAEAILESWEELPDVAEVYINEDMLSKVLETTLEA